MACNWMCVLEALILTAALVAFPVYLLFVIMLVKYRNKPELKSAFYRLLLSGGIADLAYLVHYNWLSRMPRWGWFLDFYSDYSKPLATYYLIGSWYLRHSQALGVLFMSLNRFTAIVSPAQYDNLWNSKNLRLAFVAQWLAPLATVAHMFVMCHFDYSWRENGTALEPNSGKCPPDCTCRKVTWGISTLFLFSVVGLLIFLYVVMFVTYWKHRKRVQPKAETATEHELAHKRRKEKIQMKLAINGFIISSVLIVLGIYNGLKAANPWFGSKYREANQMVSMVLFLIYSLISPFVLLALNAKVRKLYVLTAETLVGGKEEPPATKSLNPANPSKRPSQRPSASGQGGPSPANRGAPHIRDNRLSIVAPFNYPGCSRNSR